MRPEPGLSTELRRGRVRRPSGPTADAASDQSSLETDDQSSLAAAGEWGTVDGEANVDEHVGTGEHVYGAEPGRGLDAEMELLFTMRPPRGRCVAMSRMTPLAILQQAVTSCRELFGSRPKQFPPQTTAQC